MSKTTTVAVSYAILPLRGCRGPLTSLNLDSSQSEDAYTKFISALPLNDSSGDLEKLRRAKPRAPGTCEWLAHRHEFKAWFNGDEQILWIEGRPGTGKTVLSMFTVDYLEGKIKLKKTEYEKRPASQKQGGILPDTLAYYFCDARDSRRNTAGSIIGGLLQQLLQGRKELLKGMEETFMKKRLLDDTELWKVFQDILSLLKKFFGNVYLLIDGLDECESSSGKDFIRRLRYDVMEKRIPIEAKLLVTSQTDQWIIDELGGDVKTFKIEPAMVAGDLVKTIKHKVKELNLKKFFGSTKQKSLEDALIQNSGETFLWADLVVNHLDELKTKVKELDVAKVHEMIPTTLNEAYDRIMVKIWCQRPNEAKFVLQFTTVARRPLTATEIDMAYAMWKLSDGANNIPDLDTIPSKVYTSCTPLVSFDSETQTVNLLHQSAKTYLLSERPHVQLEMLRYAGILVLLSAGLIYRQYFIVLCLVSVTFQLYALPNEALLSPSAFISSISNSLSPPKFMRQYRVNLDQANFLVLEVCQKYLGRQEFDRGQKIVRYERDHILVPVSKDIPREKTNCFVEYAAEHWREHALAIDSVLVVKQLRKLRDLPSLSTLRDSLLLRAAECGHERVLRALLEEMGAQITVRDPSGKSALHLAALGGHITAVRLLINYGAKYDSRDDVGATALHWAARGGDMETFLYLLAMHRYRRYVRKASDSLIRNWLIGISLLWVFPFRSGNSPADVEMPDNEGGTLLASAIERGSENVVKYLLANGAKIEYRYFRDLRCALPDQNDMKILVHFIAELLEDLTDTLEIGGPDQVSGTIQIPRTALYFTDAILSFRDKGLHSHEPLNEDKKELLSCCCNMVLTRISKMVRDVQPYSGLQSTIMR